MGRAGFSVQVSALGRDLDVIKVGKNSLAVVFVPDLMVAALFQLLNACFPSQALNRTWRIWGSSTHSAGQVKTKNPYPFAIIL